MRTLYRGLQRPIGIYEVMQITPEISHIIMSGGNSLDIANASLKSGFNNLRMSGLEKAAKGITCSVEINRVTSFLILLKTLIKQS